jgi:putative transposase
MDFFTVPKLTFQVLYCFFIIEHGRRKILHSNVTEHPTGPWIVQQLREAFRHWEDIQNFPTDTYRARSMSAQEASLRAAVKIVLSDDLANFHIHALFLQ